MGRLAGKHVLLVEDDYVIASEMAQSLALGGLRIAGPVPSITDALSMIRSAARLDAAVLDINLRGDMAFPIADELAATRIPFVFATGYDAHVIPARFAGVARLEKPVRLEDLETALADLLF